MQPADHLFSIEQRIAHNEPMREHILEVGNGTLNLAIGPNNGPAIVLLHGVTRCWQDFNALLPALTKRWHVFAPDHRGHGKSGRPGRYQVADFAMDAAALIEKHVPGPAILLGHSLGAMVAALVAAEIPTRVRAVLMEDPPASTLAENIRQSRFSLQFTNIERLLSRTSDVDSLTRALADMEVQRPNDGTIVRFSEIRDLNTIRFSAECLLQMDPIVLKTLNEGRWLEGVDWFGALSKIQCPTLLLRADPALGSMLDEAEAVRITSLIRHCTRVDLPGIGHSIHSSQPGKMLAIITDFVGTNRLS